jgi:selenocysteine lyase/cysteine desulfurase
MMELLCNRDPVTCVDGARRRPVDLDYAASTPALSVVAHTVAEFLPWYASVHRGNGHRSRVSTRWYEEARESVARFAGARDGDVVVFLGNTTDATNTLSFALPPGSRVLGSPAEHHANLLPWRAHRLELLPFTRSPGELVDACEESLAAAGGEVRLVVLTGASNVTGEVSPIAALAAVAHRHGAELFVDAAQLAPHREISLAETGVDYVAFSGHKLYAPFGSGALVGRREGLGSGAPLRKGGGAAVRVSLEDVTWAEAPARFEAGSPNVVGAVALAAACRALADARTALEEAERALTRRLHDGLERIPGLRTLRLWPAGSCDQLGVASFTLDGFDDDQLAAILAAEWAIGVRQGRFCAHPLVAHLLGESSGSSSTRARPRGAVRASMGIGSSAEDIEMLLQALREIAAQGPRGEYRLDPVTDEWVPVRRRRSLAA